MQIKTIEDMLTLYYSDAGAKYIQKTDAPVLTTTTGVYNPNFGAEAWSQLNLESNAFGLLPKTVWNRSGWRAITARGSSTVTGGTAENGSIGDTLKPTIAEISTKPKEVHIPFNVSTRQEYLSGINGDDNWGTMDDLRSYWAMEFAEHVNKMLLTDNDTLADNNIESLDRVCGSYSEIAGVGQTAGDLDIYSQDRDASDSWTDAYVSHASGVDRSLTDALIRDMFATIGENGGNTNLILTGYDTRSKTQSLYADQARYMNPMSQLKVKQTMNGVETAEGTEVGLNVATIYGVPMFVSKNVASDTISRMYFLDSTPAGTLGPRLHMKVAKPVMYFEAKDKFLELGALQQKAMYYFMGELICNHFAAQGKLRDLET